MAELVIDMLPACEGDCLLVTYGGNRRILIDCGRASTYPHLKATLEKLPADERELELLVITHVDRDHIEGAIKLLEDDACPGTFRDIWFNGYAHLVDPERVDEDFGGVMGERVTTALMNRPGRWNNKFGRKAAYIAGAPTTIHLDGDLAITILSPDKAKLAKLAPKWKTECRDAGMDPSPDALPQPPAGEEVFGGGPLNVAKHLQEPFEADDTKPNGSSIGFLLKFGAATVLFGADCHVDRLMKSIDAISPGQRLALSAFKVPHHGSAKNVSKELLDRLDCTRYLISTNGSYFQHPSRSAIARIVAYGGAAPKHLYFNYKNEFTELWTHAEAQQTHGYTPHYPPGDNGWQRVVIPA